MNMAQQFGAYFWMMFWNILKSISFPYEVIWRHHMGERYITIARVIVITFILPMFAFQAFKEAPAPNKAVEERQFETKKAATGKADQNSDSEKSNFEALKPKKGEEFAYTIFIGITLACLWANKFEINNKVKQGIRWHSKFQGVPRILPDTRLTNAWIIPFGTAAIGIWLSFFSKGLGYYSFFAAASQFFWFRYDEQQRRNQMLDVLDQTISIDQMKKSLEGTEAMQCEGLNFAGTFSKAEVERYGSERMAEKLNEMENLKARYKDVLQ